VLYRASNEDWYDLVVLAHEQPNNVVDVANQRIRTTVAAICLLWDHLQAIQAGMKLLDDRSALLSSFSGQFDSSHVVV
jgi:hypothetical protein